MQSIFHVQKRNTSKQDIFSTGTCLYEADSRVIIAPWIVCLIWLFFSSLFPLQDLYEMKPWSRVSKSRAPSSGASDPLGRAGGGGVRDV